MNEVLKLLVGQREPRSIIALPMTRYHQHARHCQDCFLTLPPSTNLSCVQVLVRTLWAYSLLVILESSFMLISRRRCEPVASIRYQRVSWLCFSTPWHNVKYIDVRSSNARKEASPQLR